MLLLLSPAKSLDYESHLEGVPHTLPQFVSQSAELIDVLKHKTPAQISELMDLSDNLVALNVARYEAWRPKFSSKNSRQAILAFNGDVYEGLDAKSLTPKNLEWAQNHVCILSGLYGVLRPLDWMQPYRLEMGTPLLNPRGKNLYQFWDSKLTKNLLKETTKEEVIVNLASAEYAKAIQWKNLKRTFVQPNFKEFKNGEYKMVMVYAKQERGAMARYLIENELTDIQELKGYNLNGYSFDEKQSTETDWIFVR